jgi:polyferredoxin
VEADGSPPRTGQPTPEGAPPRPGRLVISPLGYRLLADLVLGVHVAFVAFVVCGLVAIVYGGFRGVRWTRGRRFRILHLLAIGVVAAQAWAGLICPLTTLEMALRARAGEAVYRGSFIAHWLERLLYFDAPAWVFVLVYTAFGALVAGTWWWFPPQPRRPPQAPAAGAAANGERAGDRSPTRRG